MIASVCGLEPGEFVHTFGDVHLYKNHLNQALVQLSREPRPLPKMKINPNIKRLFDFHFSDFELIEYNPWPALKGEVAV
jgi:thymidylate synthase